MKAILSNGQLLPGEKQETIQPGTDAWHAWLQANQQFHYKGEVERYSARKEMRRGIAYWYAYKRIEGVLSKKYLGKGKDLSLDTLQAIEDEFIKETWKHRKNQELVYEIEAVAYNPLSLGKKIKPPSLPANIIKRNKLLARMQRPVVFISAPSGFGKSTLLRMAYRLNRKNTAWISLSDSDNSLFLFVRLLHASFQEIGIDIAEMDSLNLSKPDQIFNFLASHILHSIQTEGRDRCVTIILDNYHQIHNNQIHRGISHLIQNLPPNLKIIIASQKKIPVSRKVFRKKEDFVEIDEDALRIPQAEALDFIRQQIGRDISPGIEMETITDLKGWVMGIVLVTAILKSGEKLTHSSKLGEQKNFQHYLINDILAKYSLGTQKFLIQTSFLKELRPDLCEYVTGIANCARIMEDLGNEDLILSRVDSISQVYNFTEIFASVLNAQLLQNSTEVINALYKRAADWYLRKGDLSQAVPYFILCKDWEALANVFALEDLGSLQRYNEGSKTLYWFTILPLEVFCRNFEFLLISLFVNVLYGYQFRLSDYAEGFQKMAAEKNMDPRLIDFTEIILSAIEKNEPIDEEILRQYKGSFKSSNYEGLLYLLNLYRLCTTAIGSDAIDLVAFEQMLNTIFERGYFFIYILGTFTYGSFLQQSGDLNHAEEFLDQSLITINRVLGRYSTTTIFLLAIKVMIYIQRNESEKALPSIEMFPFYSRKRLPILDSPTYLYYLLSIKYSLFRRDIDMAQKNLDLIAQFYKRFPSKLYQVDLMKALHAEIYVHKGNYRTAEDLLQSGIKLFKIQEAAVAWCHCLMHSNRFVELQQFVKEVTSRNRFRLRYSSAASLPLFGVMARLGQGEIFSAFDLLLQILPRYAQNRAVQPFIEVGDRIFFFLQILLLSGRLENEEAEFVKGLFHEIGRSRELESSTEAIIALVPLFSLSQRENEILILLLNGLTNAEMAQHLFISEHTIKSHIHNIYLKLDVSGRYELLNQVSSAKAYIRARCQAA